MVTFLLLFPVVLRGVALDTAVMFFVELVEFLLPFLLAFRVILGIV